MLQRARFLRFTPLIFTTFALIAGFSASPAFSAQTSRKSQAACELEVIQEEYIDSQLELTPEFYNRNRQKIDDLTPDQKKFRDLAVTTSYDNIARNNKVVEKLSGGFSKVLPECKIENQMGAGFCWNYSFVQMLVDRAVAAGKLPKDFQLAHGQGPFYNYLEQANKWTGNLVMMMMHPGMSEGQLRQAMDVTQAVSDGGSFNIDQMVAFMHGLIPSSAMPDRPGTLDTSALNTDMDEVLSDTANELYNKYSRFKLKKGETLNKAQVQSLLDIQQAGMDRLYGRVSFHLGEPPQKFMFTDAQGITKEYTPKTFAKFLGFDPNDYATITINSSFKKNKVYLSKGTGRISTDPNNSFDIRSMAVGKNRFLQMIQQSIDAGHPVMFGADVNKDVDVATGTMDPNVFDKRLIYGEPSKSSAVQTREQRQRTNFTGEVHEMLFYAHNLPKGRKMSDRFGVQNSWGIKAGKKGNFVASPAWIKKYVYTGIIHKSVLTPEELRIYESAPEPTWMYP